MYTADRAIPASQLFALPCLHVILAACLINQFSLYMKRVHPGIPLLGARTCDLTVATRVVEVSTSRSVLLCCFCFHVVVKVAQVLHCQQHVVGHSPVSDLRLHLVRWSTVGAVFKYCTP
jgi:hypothetical protein